MEQSNSATTHSPVYALDFVPHRKPNKNPKAGGWLECYACRSPFLFYDRLRHVAVTKLDVDPTRLPEIADLLLTIHQCERRSYKYMAHVMQAAQQARRMKLAIAKMDLSTAYIVYNFKQKFLAKGFREGGDSYYGKKGMMWWGAGVFIKPSTTQEDVISSPSESTDKHYVEIDYSLEDARLRNQNQTEAVDIKQDCDFDEGDGCVLSELDEEEVKDDRDEQEWGEGHEYVCEEEGAQKWDEGSVLEGEMHQMGYEQEGDQVQTYGWDEDSEHDTVGEGSEHETECEHETEGEGREHETESKGSEHEVRGEESEHEVGGEGSEHETESEGSEHEVKGEESEHEVGDEGSEHEVGGEGSEHEVGGEGSEHGNIESEEVGVNRDDEEKNEPTLHFFDCIVQGEQKCDANVVLSCFEAALHALRFRFPHLLIIQSDNARNLAGKQTKLLFPHVCSAAGFKLVAYYHNEAQSGKDVCDTHFSHQQTHIEAYLRQGDGGQKVSTPKQLAVALMEKSITNTTVLLIKPDFCAPYQSAKCPSINGIRST